MDGEPSLIFQKWLQPYFWTCILFKDFATLFFKRWSLYPLMWEDLFNHLSELSMDGRSDTVTLESRSKKSESLHLDHLWNPAPMLLSTAGTNLQVTEGGILEANPLVLS